MCMILPCCLWKAVLRAPHESVCKSVVISHDPLPLYCVGDSMEGTWYDKPCLALNCLAYLIHAPNYSM